jgi:hypothetical protein
MTRWIRHVSLVTVMSAAIVAAGCSGDAGLKEVQRVRAGEIEIVVLANDGALNRGKDAFVIDFRRPDGSLVDVGTVTTSANMPMPGMTMPGSVQVERSEVPGRYRATGDFGMAGGWQMKVEWNGPAGQGSRSFEGTVQ